MDIAKGGMAKEFAMCSMHISKQTLQNECPSKAAVSG